MFERNVSKPDVLGKTPNNDVPDLNFEMCH